MPTSHKPFFAYPPGARGDFLRHILYSTGPLLPTPTQHRIRADVEGIRTHNLVTDVSWEPCHFIWPECADWYCTHWISVSDTHIESVAWLNLIKNEPKCKHTVDAYLKLCFYTEKLQESMKQHQCLYDWVIDFHDLWHLDNIEKLAERIASRQFDTSEKNRIQINIDMNLRLLDSNPWYGQFKTLNQDCSNRL